MGSVLTFTARHARASAKRNKDGSTLRPSVSASVEKAMKYSAGTMPRARQLETAPGKTPSLAATTEVPPHASINSSTVCKSLMPQTYSQYVNRSRVHIIPVVTTCELRKTVGMGIDHRGIKKRTRLVREALEKKPSELADELGIARSAWVQYESPKDKRLITLDVAARLRDAYGISLDWLYFGDRLSSLPEQIAEAIRKRA